MSSVVPFTPGAESHNRCRWTSGRGVWRSGAKQPGLQVRFNRSERQASLERSAREAKGEKRSPGCCVFLSTSPAPMVSTLRMKRTLRAIFSWGIWVVVVHAMMEAPCDVACCAPNASGRATVPIHLWSVLSPAGWLGRRSVVWRWGAGRSRQEDSEAEEVRRCVDVVEAAEERRRRGGLFCRHGCISATVSEPQGAGRGGCRRDDLRPNTQCPACLSLAQAGPVSTGPECIVWARTTLARSPCVENKLVRHEPERRPLERIIVNVELVALWRGRREWRRQRRGACTRHAPRRGDPGPVWASYGAF